VSSEDESLTVGQRIDHMCSAAQIAWSASCDTMREFRGVVDIDARVNRNPYGMMAAAVGSGYVLGGGLFSPLTARVVGLGLRLGLRLVAVPFIQREIVGFAEAACASDANSSSSHDQASAPNAVNNNRR
jgi:hypothetical protein